MPAVRTIGETKNMKRAIPALIAMLCSAHGGLASAQGSTDAENAGALAEVVVTGVRAALINAIETKRNADSIIDGISADDMGKFPDLNLAESLQRVTGVQMDYSGDETQRRVGRIAIRGLPTTYSLTTFNGQILAAPEPDYGFAYGALNSEVVSALNVIKTPTAKMDEGGLSGVVDIVTRRALDLDADYTSVSVKTTYESLLEDQSPTYSLSFGRVFDDRWGVVGSISAGEQHFRGDAIRVNAYTGVDRDGNGLSDLYIPNEFRMVSTDSTGDRLSATLGLDFQISDNVRFGVQGLHAEDPYLHDMELLQIRRARTTTITDTLVNATVGDTVIEGVMNFPEVTPQIRLIDAESVTDALTATLNWESGNWKTTATAHMSRATYDSVGYQARRNLRSANNNGINIYFNTAGGDVGGFSLRELTGDLENPQTYSHGTCTASEAAAGRTPSQCVSSSSGSGDWFSTYASGYEYDMEEKETSFALDVTREFEGTWLTSVDGGVKLRKMKQFRSRPEWELSPTRFDYSQIDDLGVLVEASGIRSGGSGFFDGALGDRVDNYYAPDPRLVQADLLRGASLSGELFGGLPSVQGDFNSTYSDSDRDITSVYLMANFDLANSTSELPLRGNVGVRYVQTDRSVSAFRDIAGVAEPLRAETDFSHVLPSANLVWDVSDELIVRASYAETIVRPHAGNYSVSQVIDVTYTDATQTAAQDIAIQLGNPDLRPFEAESIDLSLEWYPSTGNTISLAYFQKKVRSGISNQVLCPSALSDISALSGSAVLGLVTGGLAADGAGVCTDQAGVPVIITGQVNTNDGFDISGYEVGVLQMFDFIDMPVIRNMGVQLNYTYIDASESANRDASGRVLPLAGVSDKTVNVIAFYEADPFAIRLAYTSRSDYYDETRFTVSGENRFIESANRLDLSASYTPTWLENLTLTFEAFNLTDEQFRAYQGSPERFRELREVGQTYSLAAVYRF